MIGLRGYGVNVVPAPALTHYNGAVRRFRLDLQTPTRTCECWVGADLGRPLADGAAWGRIGLDWCWFERRPPRLPLYDDHWQRHNGDRIAVIGVCDGLVTARRLSSPGGTVEYPLATFDQDEGEWEHVSSADDRAWWDEAEWAR